MKYLKLEVDKQAIEQAIKIKHPNWQVFVKVPIDNDLFDILEMVALGIGCKFIEVDKEYGAVIAFKQDEVTDENIQLVIDYLNKIAFGKDKIPLMSGVAVSPKSINYIKQYFNNEDLR